jgi:hypothetical protein
MAFIFWRPFFILAKNIYKVKHISNINEFLLNLRSDEIYLLGERIQAQYGQPGVPLYTHIELPETNQRIEGPAKTEAAVRRLLKRIESEQSRVMTQNRDSQKEASNQAANVLFNYTDELKGLGWMII